MTTDSLCNVFNNVRQTYMHYSNVKIKYLLNLIVLFVSRTMSARSQKCTASGKIVF